METIISIHALREEGDTHTIARVDGRRKFLSTPSARRATQPVLLRRRGAIFLSTPSARRATGRADVGYTGAHISIHALREEGDASVAIPSSGQLMHFYPRPPRGGRLLDYMGVPTKIKFLSTPSARRATASKRNETGRTAISIHALREEGDRSAGMHLRYA